jgi:hypothetical protein
MYDNNVLQKDSHKASLLWAEFERSSLFKDILDVSSKGRSTLHQFLHFRFKLSTEEAVYHRINGVIDKETFQAKLVKDFYTWRHVPLQPAKDAT